MSNGGEEGCKNVKRGVALLLAASMMTFLLAGCGSNQVTTENTGSSDYRPDRGLPYIISLLVLAVSSKKSRAPKAEGIPYEKGQREDQGKIFVWGSPEWETAPDVVKVLC